MFRGSLRNKLVGVFLLPTLVTVLLYGLLAFFAARQGLEEELGRRLVAVGQAMASDISDGLDAAQIERLDPTKVRVLARLRDKLTSARDATGVRRIFIFDSDHQSLVDTDESVVFGQQLYQLEADRLEIERTFLQAMTTTSVLFTSEDGTLHKSGYVPLMHEGQVIGVLAVEAGADYFDLVNNFASILTILGLLAILLVVVAGHFFAQGLTRPLKRLVEAARRLGRGQWHEPVVELDPHDGSQSGARADTGGDEIDFLANAFEEMRLNIVRRDRQMQMMLSGIAHEVRNPLGGMELFCGLLREEMEAAIHDEDSEAQATSTRQVEMVTKIQRELSYLEKVVKDFLDFARSAPLERERFLAREFAEEIAALMAGEVDDAKCALTVSLQDPELELAGDRERLRRAVINVVRNAYQACPDGGAIALEFEAAPDGGRLLRVRDDGPGIPDDKISEVWTPFYTTKQKGSGLGLALTRQIIEQHGGQMAIRSRTGEGTTIEFCLPFDASIAVKEEVVAEIPEGWLG